MIVIVVISYTILGVFEFVPLYKQKKWPDIIVNAVLFSFSFVVAVLLCFEVDIPSPSGSIRRVVISIFGK
jgi:hypothetical protein